MFKRYRRKIAVNRYAGSVVNSMVGIAMLMMLVACSALPSRTPEAIGLAGERIELNAVAAHVALANLVDNAEISRKQIEAACKKLKQIDGTMSDEDRHKVLQEALQLLNEASTAFRCYGYSIKLPQDQTCSTCAQQGPH